MNLGQAVIFAGMWTLAIAAGSLAFAARRRGDRPELVRRFWAIGAVLAAFPLVVWLIFEVLPPAASQVARVGLGVGMGIFAVAVSGPKANAPPGTQRVGLSRWTLVLGALLAGAAVASTAVPAFTQIGGAVLAGLALAAVVLADRLPGRPTLLPAGRDKRDE